VPRAARFVLIALVALLAVPAATVSAATRMPIGFFDDPSFRWSPERVQNLAGAAATGATVIHTTANWALIAPTRPQFPADADDHAYKFGDLDQLVSEAARHGLRVMVDITGTPKWANGNQSPNHMPTHLSDLATFAKMLALRYDGRNPGKGQVSLWSVWNEPNLQQFLTPQYVGKRIVSPANYAKLYKTVYAAIKSQNPWAKVAIGETSAQGRDKPRAGASQTVSPGTFAKLLAKIPGLRFDAWAHHPYPTSRTAKPLEKVRYPNVTLSQLPTFEKQLKATFHRAVPIWITEYGHETKPAQPRGVTYAQQSAYAAQALTIAKNDPNVQMFCWFTFRDSAGNPWKSGLEQASGAPKPAFATFSTLAHQIDGTTVAAKAGQAMGPVSIFVPYLTFYNPVGSLVGVTYRVSEGGTQVAAGEPQSNLAPDGSVTFTPSFTPAKGRSYTITATVNDANGNLQTRIVAVKTA
jgi:Cellulase (glycosyl hydrolase family 5)